MRKLIFRSLPVLLVAFIVSCGGGSISLNKAPSWVSGKQFVKGTPQVVKLDTTGGKLSWAATDDATTATAVDVIAELKKLKTNNKDTKGYSITSKGEVDAAKLNYTLTFTVKTGTADTTGSNAVFLFTRTSDAKDSYVSSATYTSSANIPLGTLAASLTGLTKK